MTSGHTADPTGVAPGRHRAVMRTCPDEPAVMR
jgi:hypothetical protein